MRPLEQLSKKQRQATPGLLASYLLEKVRERHKCHMVACLWVAEGTVYLKFPDTDLWPKSRDANLYRGPYPIIAHPPCGPWGKYKANCFHSREDGIIAMELVHKWGGVVEQPLGSSLFREYGHWWAPEIHYIEQGAYGHPSLKPTLLYWSKGEK